MRLARLELKNYRSCLATTVKFAKHLTLLVGENDAGKSNIIDALRVALPAASGRQSLYFDLERDLSYGVGAGAPIEVTRTYSGLSAAEEAIFTPVLVDMHRDLVHTTIFRTEPDLLRRQRLAQTVSDARIADPEPENRDRIAHVYLPPLRDAARALDSADGNRLADIFEVIASKGEIASFEDAANKSLGELANDVVAKRVVAGVQEHLTSVTQPVRHRVVDVRHREQRLRRLTRALRLHMAAAGLTPSDLLGSGLGYANLLYIATVVLELVRASDFDLTVLLVEEPEAHLHPQLQSVLLSYLYEQAIQSDSDVEPGSLEPAGRIQVIATTHSPHLASAVSTANLVVVRAQPREEPDGDQTIEAPVADDGEEAPAPRYGETVAVALGDLALSPMERRKVDRYLDATKAALLFARQVILVEGIAEALLLRTLAEQIVYPRSQDGDGPAGLLNRQLREQFRAISILPVDGVDFMPYVKVVLGAGANLCDRLVVVTDGDGGPGDQRKADLEAAFPDQVASGCLRVVVGATTLEAELYAAVTNEQTLRDAFLVQHPHSGQKWDEICPAGTDDAPTRAAAFSKVLKNKKLELGKGDFAQVVAGIIEDADAPAFVIPPYLREALEAIILDQAEA